MANLEDILSNLEKIPSNPNNNSFINLMRGISGDPSDNVEPLDDPESIAGAVANMYNEIVAGRASDQAIANALDVITNLTASATQVEAGDGASATLVGSDIQFEIPRGVPGMNGQNGLTPIIEFNVVDGVLEYEVVGYDSQVTPIIEEW